ncbi:hypothetical protein N6H14_16000 [Paenibacillus sp. CC-CFT747]|nr:hypothetical protein N6H14_16000 [Paenibacillus sp. CC-CFT747]
MHRSRLKSRPLEHYLERHPRLLSGYQRMHGLWAVLGALLLAILFVASISALILRLSPIEPLHAEGMGEIITTAKYLDLSPIAEVEGKPAARPFYFTTLHTMKLNNRLDALRSAFLLENTNSIKIASYALSSDLDLTTGDYSRISKFSLYRSSENLTYLAYQYAGLPADFPTKVIIVFPLENYETGKAFKPNDVILAINGKPVSTWKEYAEVNNQLPSEEGYTALYKVQRGKDVLELPVTFTEKNKKGAYINGLYAAEVKDFQDAVEPANLVTFTRQFSGDSAGLMMTLQLIQELSGKDLTKGYYVAGTGTIDKAGRVGEIGGMPLKIMTADKQRVDLYFVPKAVEETDRNEQEAFKTAQTIHSTMKIVPVASVADALDYLDRLPSKNQG